MAISVSTSGDPPTPTSDSPSTSRSESPELQLGASTLALLDSFLAEKDEERRLFEQFEAHALQLDEGFDVPDAATGVNKPGLTVDEFRKAFAEDWQLSQFW